MIEINLLPEELKKAQKPAKRFAISKFDLFSIKDAPVLNLCLAVFATLLAIQMILFFIGIYSKTGLGSLNRYYKKISLKKKEAETLRSEAERMNRKMKVIDELMVKRFSWARKLNDLSDSVTSGIWLTELSYDEKMVEKPASVEAKAQRQRNVMVPLKQTVTRSVSKYLVISGYASSMGEEGTASIGKFIKSLKENPSFYSDFSDIELGSIKRDKVDGQEVMSFKITCLFKETR